MGLLKVIAIFLAVFYGIKYLFRLLMPFALRKMAERLVRKAQQSPFDGRQGPYSYRYGSFGFGQQSQKTDREGEIRVDFVPKNKSKTKKGMRTAGEFVDFEEV